MSNFDVIVIGTGVAGLAASKVVAQKGLRTASVEQLLFGGLVVNINELDGEIEGSGTDYASNLMMEASDLGVENLSETVSAIAGMPASAKIPASLNHGAPMHRDPHFSSNRIIGCV